VHFLAFPCISQLYFKLRCKLIAHSPVTLDNFSLFLASHPSFIARFTCLVHTMADSTAVHDDTRTKPQQSVRFGSTSEISPTNTSDTIHPANEKGMEENLTEEQRKELREMSVSLQQSRLQSARMDQFVFDPVSLPASRVRSKTQLHYLDWMLTTMVNRFHPLDHPHRFQYLVD
jgi:hypothetical protein